MADNYVTINSLRLDIDGFARARDLTPLMEVAYRGSDFVAQGVAGSTYRPKVRDSLRLLLPLYVYGKNDKDGVAHANPYAGIRANVEQIITSCVTGSASATVTLSATYEDAVTRTASVYCPRLDVGLVTQNDKGRVASAVLEVVIPAGQLT